MSTLPFWQLARPWTPAQWNDIVTLAKLARERRARAKAARLKETRQLDFSADSNMLYWQARNAEQAIRNCADVRLGDLDEERVNNYLNVTAKDKQ